MKKRINSKVLKLINLLLFFRNLIYFLFNKDLRTKFPEKIPGKVIDIGYFINNSKVKTKNKYNKYFKYYDVINEKDTDPSYKSDTIRLVFINNEVLIKKSYNGALKRRLKFYSELIVLEKLRKLRNVPNIRFVDFDNLVIYLQFIDGYCLTKSNRDGNIFSIEERNRIKNRSEYILRIIHKNRIAVIDIQSRNIIFDPNQKDVFFIDFADSVSCKCIPDKLLYFLQKLDTIKLWERVIRRI